MDRDKSTLSLDANVLLTLGEIGGKLDAVQAAQREHGSAVAQIDARVRALETVPLRIDALTQDMASVKSNLKGYEERLRKVEAKALVAGATAGGVAAALALIVKQLLGR